MSLAADLAPLVQITSWLRHGPATGGPEQREAVERFIASVNLPWAESPANEDASKDAATVLYLHGGGLVHYGVITFEPLLQHWRTTHGLAIEAVDYPHAPEHSVLVILAHVVNAIRQRIERATAGARFVLAGDSIGGYLSLQAWRQLRREQYTDKVAALALIYPVLDLVHEGESYKTYGCGYTLDATAMSYFKSLWTAHYSDAADLRALACDDFTDLPNVYVASAGCDVLRDEAFAWCEHMTRIGVPVQHTCFDDLSHDFCLFAGRSPSCLQAINHIGAAIAVLSSTQGARTNECTRFLPAQAGLRD